MTRNILDSAAGGAFMEKTIVEAKNILESILQNYSQWHTDRAPSSSKKVNSIEETHDLSSKMDTILALLNKPSIENIPLQEIVGDNSENIDVNFIRNYLIFTNWRHCMSSHVNPQDRKLCPFDLLIIYLGSLD